MPRSGGIDILFATHNGARTLPRMLAALRQLKAPIQPWQILAVDNASTDDTFRLLKEASADLPLSVLSCPEPGKLPALRFGAARVKGDLVLFTDDDIVPEPQWLAAYEAAALAAPDNVAIFGGPIIPTPIEPLTPWFEASREYHAELFAFSDEPEGAVDATMHIFGPNFLIRRDQIDVLDDIAPGLGPPSPGRNGRGLGMGEDTMIMELLIRRGLQARYVRGACVKHMVRAFQTELGYMLERAQRHGRGTAIRLVEAKRGSLPRRARILVEEGIRGYFRSGLGSQSPTPEVFKALWAAHWSRGAALGAALGPYSARR